MDKVNGTVVSSGFMTKENGRSVNASAELFQANGKGSADQCFRANLHRKETTVGEGVAASSSLPLSLFQTDGQNNSNGDVCFSSEIPGWYADASPLWPGLLPLDPCSLSFCSRHLNVEIYKGLFRNTLARNTLKFSQRSFMETVQWRIKCPLSPFSFEKLFLNNHLFVIFYHHYWLKQHPTYVLTLILTPP